MPDDRKTFTLELDAAQMARLEELANSTGRDLSDLVEEAVTGYLGNHSPRTGVRPDVMALYQSTHENFAPLYKKLAE